MDKKNRCIQSRWIWNPHSGYTLLISDRLNYEYPSLIRNQYLIGLDIMKEDLFLHGPAQLQSIIILQQRRYGGCGTDGAAQTSHHAQEFVRIEKHIQLVAAYRYRAGHTAYTQRALDGHLVTAAVIGVGSIHSFTVIVEGTGVILIQGQLTLACLQSNLLQICAECAFYLTANCSATQLGQDIFAFEHHFRCRIGPCANKRAF